MKKLFIAGLFLFTVVSLSAQTKINKTSVIGKWTPTIIKIAGPLNFSYDFEKDSLVIDSVMKAQMDSAMKAQGKDTISRTAFIAGLDSFSKMFFQFNADGTAIIDWGMQGSLSHVTYRVDEENSTIPFTDRYKHDDIMKAEMIKDKLRLVLKLPDLNNAEMIVTLKKATN